MQPRRHIPWRECRASDGARRHRGKTGGRTRGAGKDGGYLQWDRIQEHWLWVGDTQSRRNSLSCLAWEVQEMLPAAS